MNLPMWDAARWCATAFVHDTFGERPPCLGIVFEDMEAGRRIFAEWRRLLGRVDKHEQLRIALVEGDIPGKPAGYTVHVSSDPEGEAR
jgi:hypothetical protein